MASLMCSEHAVDRFCYPQEEEARPVVGVVREICIRSNRLITATCQKSGRVRQRTWLAPIAE
jgi:hypothetical protein